MPTETIKCSVCGTLLHFVEYGKKTGKDGREAKWPIYEKCPNKENHSKAINTKKDEKREEVKKVVAPVAIPDNIPVASGLKSSLNFIWEVNKLPTVEDFNHCVDKYIVRHGKAPTSARTNLNHYHHFMELMSASGHEVALSVDLKITKEWPQLELDVSNVQ